MIVYFSLCVKEYFIIIIVDTRNHAAIRTEKETLLAPQRSANAEALCSKIRERVPSMVC